MELEGRYQDVQDDLTDFTRSMEAGEWEADARNNLVYTWHSDGLDRAVYLTSRSGDYEIGAAAFKDHPSGATSEKVQPLYITESDEVLILLESAHEVAGSYDEDDLIKDQASMI